MRFAVLDGVSHQYPNGRNNPAGFAAAPEFWNFFQTHRLAASTSRLTPNAPQATPAARREEMV
jgi:N-acetylmuramoyl-L-alanine amidase CwlA